MTKFNSSKDELIYNSDMLDQFGDSSLDRWTGLVEGRKYAWIVEEDSQGFVEVTTYDNFEDALEDFIILRTDYYRCDSCNAVMINGVYCHETGCPNKRKQEEEESEFYSGYEEESNYDY